MAKRLILSIVLVVALILTAMFAIILISGNNNVVIKTEKYVSNCNSNCGTNNDVLVNYDRSNAVKTIYETNSKPAIQNNNCYEEIIQVKNPGECYGLEQEKRLCYQHTLTCSGMKTQSIDCYDEVDQVKGDGECISVPQEKKECYKNVQTCSGMKTIKVSCYEEVDQEKSDGNCYNLLQEKSDCLKEQGYNTCN